MHLLIRSESPFQIFEDFGGFNWANVQVCCLEVREKEKWKDNEKGHIKAKLDVWNRHKEKVVEIEWEREAERDRDKEKR